MRASRRCLPRHFSPLGAAWVLVSRAFPVQLAAMKTFLTVLIVLAMVGVLGVLLAGMVAMVRGEGNPMRSNRLMRYRVILQGAAVALFMLLMLIQRG